MNRFVWVLLSTSLLGCVGCASSIPSLRAISDLHRSQFQEKIQARQELAREFVACSARAHDQAADDSSAAPLLDAASGASPSLAGLVPIRAVIKNLLPMKKEPAFEDLLAVVEALKTPSESRLTVRMLETILDLAKQWHAHQEFSEDELAKDTSQFARLLWLYNKAYFGDLTFTVEKTVDASGIRGVAKTVSSGFVDRNGNAYLFPGISVEIEKTGSQPPRLRAAGIQSPQVTADLVRLFLEAFFDAAFRVPAEEHATALLMTGKAGEPPYPKFDASHAPITVDQFARITRDALRAEAAVMSAVGRAVRGGSLFSLNNETAAAAIETAAGVIAKKLVEHEGFCYYHVATEPPRTAGQPDAHSLTQRVSELRGLAE